MNKMERQEIKNLGLQHVYMLTQNTPSNKAKLSNLRKTTPGPVKNLPDIWAYLYAIPIPEGLSAKETERIENALLGSLLVFAQESRHNSEPHKKNKFNSGLGKALKSVSVQRGNTDSKFSSLVEEKDYFAFLRKLLNLLRLSGDSTSIDYGNLIWELYQVQNPNSRNDVLLSWGRDYYSLEADEKEPGKDLNK